MDKNADKLVWRGYWYPDHEQSCWTGYQDGVKIFGKHK